MTKCKPERTVHNCDMEYYSVSSVYAYIDSDLSNMYHLLRPINGGLGVLIEEVESHIKSTGLAAVRNLKGDNVSCTVLISKRGLVTGNYWTSYHIRT